jgi:hypothetical protein
MWFRLQEIDVFVFSGEMRENSQYIICLGLQSKQVIGSDVAAAA